MYDREGSEDLDADDVHQRLQELMNSGAGPSQVTFPFLFLIPATRTIQREMILGNKVPK